MVGGNWKKVPDDIKEKYNKQYEEENKEYLIKKQMFMEEFPFLSKIKAKRLTKKSLRKFVMEQNISVEENCVLDFIKPKNKNKNKEKKEIIP